MFRENDNTASADRTPDKRSYCQVWQGYSGRIELGEKTKESEMDKTRVGKKEAQIFHEPN